MAMDPSTAHLGQPPPYSEHIPALGLLTEPSGGRITPDPSEAIVDSLPVETLQAILHFVCTFSSADPGIVEVRQAQATVRSFILVSRLWHMVALGEKAPWCLLLDFHLCSAPASARLLELSDPLPFKVGHRSTPLLVNLSKVRKKETCKSIAVINLLCEHQERIQEIHVRWECYGSGVLEDKYLAFCGLPMPRLEALSWRGRGPFDSSLQIAGHTTTFMAPHLPHLRRFNATESAFLLDQCFPTSLTELAITNPGNSRRHRGRPTFLQLRELLKSTPNLRLLLLSNALEISALAASSLELPPVELPHLRLVTVNGGISSQDSLSEHLALLTSINSSPMCGLDISALTSAPTDDISLMVQQRIATLFQMSNPLEIGLYLTVDEWRHLSLGNITNPEHALDWTHLGGDAVCSVLSSLPMPVVTFKFVGTQSSQVAILLYLSPVRDRVTSFQIHLSPPSPRLPSTLPPPLDYTSLYASFCYLTELTLNSKAAEASFNVLVEQLQRYNWQHEIAVSEEISAVSKNELLLPFLYSVTLDYCDLVEGLELYELLYAFLSQKWEAELPISMVLFKRSNVDGGELATLARLFNCDMLVEPSNFDYLEYSRFCSRL
ncbi:hypothetical protein D9611_012687 [Ephemerocybe angulata]|uniref:Uncharacterized protein n=1 Tax=Ephemerocybe angulata TaxID=980116 RepID=A0A8H5B921_9AGAR|nr:hypothetical protein D9611_012687 [Tulosesus angulatus]